MTAWGRISVKCISCVCNHEKQFKMEEMRKHEILEGETRAEIKILKKNYSFNFLFFLFLALSFNEKANDTKSKINLPRS